MRRLVLAGVLWPVLAWGQESPTLLNPWAGPPQQQQPPAQAEPSPPAGAQQAPSAEQPAPPQWPNTWVAQGTAEIAVLDKIEGVTKDLAVKVGQSVTYGSLTIAVQACVVRPPDQPADAAAFLVITDSHPDEPGFRGWSLENEPWVSMLQHPVYDVWVRGCEP